MTERPTYRSSLSRTWLSLSLLGAVACGPPALAPVADTDSETSSSSTDDSTSTSTTSTTTADTTADTTEDTTDDDGATSFVPLTEYIHGHPCDPLAQDCPEDEKCVAYAGSLELWNDSKCVPVTGNQPAGQPCSYGGLLPATDDCDADSACWEVVEVDGMWSGVCHSFCMGTYDNPQCPEDTSCLITAEGSITLCDAPCDPLGQDCGEGLGCYWSDTQFTCVFTTTNLPAGEACGLLNDCSPASACLSADVVPGCADASCCAPFCDLNLGDAQCGILPGTSCVPFYEEAPPGGEDIGVCVSP